MKNKEQKLEFVRGEYLWDLNRLLDENWEVKKIHPIVPKDEQFGAYILLEKEIETPQISENLIDAFTNIGIALYDNKGKIKSLNQILKEVSQKWEELITLENKRKGANDTRSFAIEPKDVERIDEWKARHEAEKHNGSNYAGAIGGRYTYEFTPTSIGIFGRVRCTCGDHFDYDDGTDW